ncbi:peptidoglycan DD-metalloendopeptidase family protein [Anditalea andensis]|uniref:Peptidase M23 n=1 Tax=Anditalea andensis TaxID=1048983 RepID=A0A074KWB4_9BACT|nr:peptidoglycan DD-metalloendopeptidase family protein [Anditalea andensis]KEO73209.1 peptidase M23 [Anditalea andensis]
MTLQLIPNISPYPLMGEVLNDQNTIILDFTEANTALAAVDLKNPLAFQEFVFGQMKGKKFGIGGYLENRQIYRRSEVFASGEKFRNIHLGIDIWAPAGSRVHAPLSGTVHSFKDNIGYGNYGPTIILQHQLSDRVIYSLYGHLGSSDLDGLYEGKEFAKGEPICHLGEEHENGNWPPHLHFQLMLDMKDLKGDFPGVCCGDDAEYYQSICPDPNFIIRYQGLPSTNKT